MPRVRTQGTSKFPNFFLVLTSCSHVAGGAEWPGRCCRGAGGAAAAAAGEHRSATCLLACQLAGLFAAARTHGVACLGLHRWVCVGGTELARWRQPHRLPGDGASAVLQAQRLPVSMNIMLCVSIYRVYKHTVCIACTGHSHGQGAEGGAAGAT